MWMEVLKAVLAVASGVGTAVAVMVTKDKRDHKRERKAEQRQILIELLTAISTAERLNISDSVLNGYTDEERKAWTDQNQAARSEIHGLVSRCTSVELRTRLRLLKLIGPRRRYTFPNRDAAYEFWGVLEAEGTDVAAEVLADAHRVVGAASREESLPGFEYSKVLAGIEESFRLCGGEFHKD